MLTCGFVLGIGLARVTAKRASGWPAGPFQGYWVDWQRDVLMWDQSARLCLIGGLQSRGDADPSDAATEVCGIWAVRVASALHIRFWKYLARGGTATTVVTAAPAVMYKISASGKIARRIKVTTRPATKPAIQRRISFRKPRSSAMSTSLVTLLFTLGRRLSARVQRSGPILRGRF
jgi:hypothetical protein